jgi:ribonuclease G
MATVSCPTPGPTTFAFTGGAQSYTVPCGVTRIRIEAWGSQGGGPAGGNGGYVRGELTVSNGQVLQVFVGGRTGFLHVADILSPPPDPGNDAPREERPEVPDIRTLVREGDELLVQVVKDPLGTKGARLSTHVSLPSRYLVYIPRGARVGVSSRIESGEVREQLRAGVAKLAGEGERAGGYIVRTAALDAPPEMLEADMDFLTRLWAHVRERALATPAGKLVHEDLPLTLRVLRDELREHVRRVLVDSAVEFARMQEFARTFTPEYADRIELHEMSRPIFDLHGVEQ